MENGEGMSQEEFEALQAAIVASMGQDEQIIIGRDEEEEAGGGLISQMMGMLGLGSQNEENKEWI